ncbi:hypothetical protein JB92DRAFT_2699008, partial [Gautieria morchelliformis]
DDEPEVFDSGFLELTSLRFKEQLVLLKPLQDRSYEFPIFRERLCEYEDVIKVHADDTLYNHISENIIHHGRPGNLQVDSWTALLPLVPFPNPDIVESPSDIQLRKVPCTPELVDELRDEWDRVLVLDNDCIQGSVILY